MSLDLHKDADSFDSILGWREPVTPARLSRAAVVSIAIHIVLFAVFWSLPHVEYEYRRPIRIETRTVTKLYAPRIEQLTQKAPNTGKVTNELDIRSASQAKRAPRSFQPPAPVGPANRPPSPTPDFAPPDLELNIEAPQIAGISGIPDLPRPPAAKPKIENIAPAPTGPSPNAQLKMPKSTGMEYSPASGRAGGGGGGVLSDGENGDPTAVGNMQLLSDPENVDFRPYMQQVLAVVRRQWFAIIPQIARTGRQGIVVLQFSVDRGGQVPKLVIANTSGTVAFDQAAVASVSASNPFPPLPAEYKGTEIRLQLAFSYNVPRTNNIPRTNIPRTR